MGRLTLVVCALGLGLAVPCAAQVLSQVAAAPTVTASGESWFQQREPIVYAGSLYYRAGAQTHFDNNEMVPTGSFRGVPLFARTTLEPYSIVFVPVGGGLMQPYERLRTGVLAGTVGSTTPSFPVMPASERADGAREQAQSPAPPTIERMPLPVDSGALSNAPDGPREVGTTGQVAITPAGPTAPAAVFMPRRGTTGHIYIEFEHARWASRGATVRFDTGRFSRVGEYHGLPVYTAIGQPASTIYLPVGGDITGVVVPYTRVRSTRRADAAPR